VHDVCPLSGFPVAMLPYPPSAPGPPAELPRLRRQPVPRAARPGLLGLRRAGAGPGRRRRLRARRAHAEVQARAVAAREGPAAERGGPPGRPGGPARQGPPEARRAAAHPAVAAGPGRAA
ncbi:unnamed protein product, partial [Prorocentrum cordatum]